MRIKKLCKGGKNSRYLLIDKNILEILNIKEKVIFELKGNGIFITPYNEETDIDENNLLQSNI